MLSWLRYGQAELRRRQGRSHHGAPLGGPDDVVCPYVGAFALAKRQDPAGIRSSSGNETVPVRAVERNDGRAAGLEPLEYLSLGIGNLLFAGEEFAVGGSDGGDEGDVRA